MQQDKYEKKIDELDASILNVLKTIDDIRSEVGRVNEDTEATNKLMKVLQEYLYVVVENFHKLEALLQKERTKTAFWRGISVTLICFNAMLAMLIIMS